MKLVSDVMTREITMINPLAPARRALELMRGNNIQSLVVEKNGPHGAYGIVTYTSLLKAMVEEEGDIDLLHVYDIAARPAIGVHPALAVRHAAQMMSNLGIRRLLVLDNGELVGMVSMRYLIEALAEDLSEA